VSGLDIIKPLISTVIFLSLLGLVWSYVATSLADTNIPAAQQGLVTLVGVIFTLGGIWAIARMFGMGGSTRHTRR